jgi:phage/plasmid-like protein (TIGR03299 family)
MAHQVETMVYVGDKPWHGLGKAIPEGTNLSIEDAMQFGGLNWEVKKFPLCWKHPLSDGSFFQLNEDIEGHVAVVRDTDMKFLGVVGSRYQIIQNSEVFEWFQPFLDDGHCTIESAGSLFGGRRIWVLAKVNSMDANIVTGVQDPVQLYILLANAHDGTLQVHAGFTQIRVVCNNTLSFAIASDKEIVKLRHTSGVKDRLVVVRDLMMQGKEFFTETITQYRTLAGIRITDEEMLENYFREVFQVAPKKENVVGPGGRLLPKVMWLYDHGKGTQGLDHNYWRAFNAVTEYTNYFQGRTQDGTMNSVWLGDGAKINERALQIALKAA